MNPRTIVLVVGLFSSSLALAQTCFATPPWTASAFYGNRATLFADVNGDGLADAIAVNDETIPGGAIVALYAISGSLEGFETTHRQLTSSFPFYGDKATFMVDVNGGGIADAVAVKSTQIMVRTSSGTAPLNSELAWTTDPFYGEIATFMADVDNDQKADVIAVNNSGIFIRRSTGTSFGPTETWSSVPFYGEKVTAFADVTGDGRADAIAVNTNGTYIRRSNGATFLSNELWTSRGGFFGDHGTFFADVNGDLKADAIISDTASGVVVRLSTGTAFGSSSVWLASTITPNYGTVVTAFAAVTNSTKADLIMVPTSGGIQGRPNWTSYFLCNYN